MEDPITMAEALTAAITSVTGAVTSVFTVITSADVLPYFMLGIGVAMVLTAVVIVRMIVWGV